MGLVFFFFFFFLLENNSNSNLLAREQLTIFQNDWTGLVVALGDGRGPQWRVWIQEATGTLET